MNNRPIGIFDSGVGGLSILKHIHRLLPNEDIIYVADSGYAPYGCRGDAYIEERSRVMTEFLLEKQVKAIVIACNTATASIIEKFRSYYGLPFVGVEPGIKPALLKSRHQRIGVMATTGTLASQRYADLMSRFAGQASIINQPCPGLADQVEMGQIDTQETERLLQQFLAPLIAQKVDTIVLGCTHYSFLKRPIQAMLTSAIEIIDTSQAVAEQLVRIIHQLDCCASDSNPVSQYFTTGDVNSVQRSIALLLEKNVKVSDCR